MLRKSTVLISVIFTAAAIGSAYAETALSIKVPGGPDAIDNEAVYDCGDFTLKARYVTSGEISLARLEWPEHLTVAAQVISASGARYAAGPWVWWTKGNGATLYNVMDGENDPGIACETAS
ncbi:MliC family protein [Martelella radicis]|uniref:Membrane-bound inhibitor of C-type lysozyme n=1 Tax=Martelella radicis TaxID=1397476 RepID=A0A7W6P9Z1_9HYPH|nr:MliC family protein [Martelella radicis]MBB4121059.1 membrane-bound inhibitor of C-type lysozyme [Martelella radicis]